MQFFVEIVWYLQMFLVDSVTMHDDVLGEIFRFHSARFEKNANREKTHSFRRVLMQFKQSEDLIASDNLR